MGYKIYLYNTLTRKKEEFKPINPNNVRMYVCGPTLYDDIHIGNARPLIVFDIVYRLLKTRYKVNYVRNVTDIDDKIIARATLDFPTISIGEATKLLVKQTEQRFNDICDCLGCEKPNLQPAVSENLPAIYKIIENLVSNKYAYVAKNHILFDINSYKNYGQFSKRKPDELLAGARVEVADYKKNEGDFVLWKPAKAGEPSWPSPCGIEQEGRPGWHIECSAMSMEHLCVPYGGGICKTSEYNIFDIHGGGIDLMFPHHENEIAQSCCSLQINNMANYWLYNGYVEVEGNKMSKSEGNFIKVKDIVLDKYHGSILRLAMLQTHYRKNFNWTSELYNRAKNEYMKWLAITMQVPSDIKADITPVLEALADDLNSAQAITIMREYYKNKQHAELYCAMKFLGFEILKEVANEFIKEISDKREQAIANKDWDQADHLRKEIEKRGYIVQDLKDTDGGRYSKIIKTPDYKV